MSMVPFITEFYGFNDVEPLMEDSFGLGIYPEDIFRPHQHSVILQPRRRCLCKRQSYHGKLGVWQKCFNDVLQVCIDVSQFTPNELTVKTLGKTVVVEGKHEEREDEHGSIQRHFLRRYTLPQGYEPKDVIATISYDVLIVKAFPSPSKVTNHNERIIQIQQTGPDHLIVKQPKAIKKLDPEIGNSEAEKMESK